MTKAAVGTCQSVGSQVWCPPLAWLTAPDQGHHSLPRFSTCSGLFSSACTSTWMQTHRHIIAESQSPWTLPGSGDLELWSGLAITLTTKSNSDICSPLSLHPPLCLSFLPPFSPPCSSSRTSFYSISSSSSSTSPPTSPLRSMVNSCSTWLRDG